MFYTVGEMAKKIGLAPSTLRYYDKEGLLPFVECSSSAIRMFKDADFEWLQVIECLKKTGMQLCNIKRFVEMAMQIDALNETLKTLEFKTWYYETAKAAGTTEIPRNMPLSDLPEEYREIRKKLRGE